MRDAQCGVVVKTPPSAPLEVAEADLLLEVLIIALDAPAQLGEIDDARERDVVRQCRKPVLRRLALARRPLNQQPFFRPRFGQPIIPMRHANAHARKPRGQPHSCAFPPFDRAPSARREPTRERLDRDWMMFGVTADQLRRPSLT
jgi:alpha-ketoglutarate-dependent taurine dioxygenase